MNKTNNNRPDRGENRKRGNETGLNAEQRAELLAKQLKLKPKSKKVLDEILANPKMSHTEAYLKHHGTVNRDSANSSVHKLLAKPSAKIYSEAAIGKAKKRIVTLVDSASENISLKASQDILDRTEGKAVQKTENTSKVVEVKLDLTGSRIGAHYIEHPNQESLPA